MSELRITISQLENMLDRQREAIVDYISTQVQPHSKTAITSEKEVNLFTEGQIRAAATKANYPHDFNILKRYVK